MAVAPLNLPGLAARIEILDLTVASLQTTVNVQAAELELLKEQLAATEAISSANVTILKSQVNAIELNSNVVQNAMQQAISSLAIMLEEIRSGDVGSVPAELTDLLSALAHIGGPL